ncbi:MAG: TetR/AcrR family transcriptional regulator [Rhodococcus sp. (in: high G+C Gram-positive bacteria)]|uniref:TetR/AcrR family transcriptional regulator n=1 Tax=Rhodococcus sp. TaxID=1831 RepID=UPI003BAEF115
MPTPGTRPRRRTQAERVAESSERILNAALELIAEQGFEATSIRAIADRAGFVRSMVNTRYGSKEGLLAAIIEKHWVTELLARAESMPTGMDGILSIIDRLREFVLTEPTRLRAFLVISFEAAGPSSIPSDQIVGPITSLESALERALRRGVEDGSVCALDDPAFHATRLVDIGIAMAYRWVIEPEGYPLAARLADWHEELSYSYGTHPEERTAPRSIGGRIPCDNTILPPRSTGIAARPDLTR